MEMSGCIGFIGVGVMGEPMCRNLALKGGESVLAWDIDPAPLDRLAADAPVARTRQAAIDGTLSIMVGGDDKVFARIRPILSLMASDITHCGRAGTGQTVKILNNMMLFQNCAALAEALAIARRAGLDEELFLQTVGKSSGDSFALRNHALKAMLPREYPEGEFSVRYALKDLAYALDLAAAENVEAKGGELARERLEQAMAEGFGEHYHPVIREVIDR